MEQELIKQAWEKYVKNKEKIPDHVKGVRQEILASWKRSNEYLKDGMNDQEINVVEYQQKIKENALLIGVAYPYLENFVTDLKESEFMIMLTDRYGCVLKSLGSVDLLSSISSNKNIGNGHYYDEKSCGTGGVGLTLAINQPVIVCGYEHYLERYHDLVCYGATICDLTNHVIGSISITGYAKNYQNVILGMVKAAKSGIEKEFALTRMNEILNSTITSMNQGIIVLDGLNHILYHNNKAEELLESKIENTKSILAYISKSTYDDLEELNKEIDNHDYTVFTTSNTPIYLVLTIKQIIIKNYHSTRILILESQIEKHKQIGLLAGFKAYHELSDLKGVSAGIESLKQLSHTIATLDTSFILKGEKGCEEDIISESIHNESSRKDSPFVKVDCSSLSNLSIELFGNNNNIGKIILANTGTLYLYEISYMPLDLQKKLYRFMITKELHELNSKYTQKLDIRVIAYSSVDLASLVEKGQFDRQLYYLLNIMTITIPPLRERKEDIPILVKYIILRNIKGIKNTSNVFDQESMEAIINYTWPGNSKQLESIIESALFASKNDTIKLNQLPVDLVNDYYSDHNTGKSLLDFNLSQENVVVSKEMQEYNELLFGIKECNGDVRKAAALLYIPVSTLYRKIKNYGINPKEYQKK